VEKISLAVNNYFSSLEGGQAVTPEGEAPAEASETQETQPDLPSEEPSATQELSADETVEAVSEGEAVQEDQEQTQDPAEEPVPSEEEK
jgi:hypothetical protein